MTKPLPPRVSVVMGSQSDLRVMNAASERLAALGIVHEIDIVSAHRTPRRLCDFAAALTDRGIEVVIAGAGGAAHLPGMIAAMTVVPVIGVPVAATKMGGMDALLSIVQMPAGVPVATVAIDNADNAAILAAQIVANGDAEVRKRLVAHKRELEQRVLASVGEHARIVAPANE